MLKSSSTAPLKPRLTARQRRREIEIIDAAARVFAERGYHGTSTQAIADALGLRQASLYYYLPSKEAALARVCEHGVANFLASAEAILRDAGAPADKLARLIASHLVPIETQRDYVRVFINERRYLSPERRNRVRKTSRRLEAIFQRVIEMGQADGTFRTDADPRVSTLAILGMCNAVINWRPAEQERGVASLAAAFAGIALEGLKAGDRKRRRT